MEEAVPTEAPLKRKLEGPSESVQCKKSSGCLPSDTAVVETAFGNSQEAPAHGDGQHNSAGLANDLAETGPNSTAHEEAYKNHGDSSKSGELELSAQALGSSSVPLEELEPSERGEVLEQDERDEDSNSSEKSELDTENDSEKEDEYESEDGDSDEDEDGSDDDSEDEEDPEHMLTTTSSSLQAETAYKAKGKEKMDDVKGKRILVLDKGKGKAILEDGPAPVSDEDDAGYLSEDPLEEVDLNNILPTRTRRRSSTHQYDFVDHGGDDDDDDDDSDA